jgi:hypothetical protein
VIPPLEERWRAHWPDALAAWSAHTMLRYPRFVDSVDADKDALGVELAAIRLKDSVVLINVEGIEKRGLAELGLPILAHEIGHHVYVPGNLSDHARCLAIIGRMLEGLPKHTVHLVANLWGDLLINDRLERRAQVPVSAVYRALEAGRQGEPTKTWTLYTRTYEVLWRTKPGTLGPKTDDPEIEADAQLLARIVRNYANEWLKGARRFAVVLYRYLASDLEASPGQTFLELGLGDTGDAHEGQLPDGLAGYDDSELDDDDDPIEEELHGRLKRKPKKPENTAPDREGQGRPGKQWREPFEYRQLLETLGIDLDEHAITTRYYRERALPHLIPFPKRRGPRVIEPLAEGYQTWSPGDPLEDLDVLGSVLGSPIVVPGVTTVARVYGESPGHEPAPAPMDLDLYVDCSGSMPNPAQVTSYLALAGAILALSALRAGAKVQATLWAHAGCFETTHGFLRDEKRVLGTVTGFLSGGTAFPIHVLRDTFAARRADDPPAHVVVISDDGVNTMLQEDELGEPGALVARRALAAARGGGTLVLNVPGPFSGDDALAAIGFQIHRVQAWEDLVAFARAFVKKHYEEAR